MLTAYLGTVPDYAQGDIKGVLLSGVSAAGPAAQAGVKGGDVIVELAGKKVENIYDYTFAIEALRVGQETEIAIRRGEEVLRLKVTPTRGNKRSSPSACGGSVGTTGEALLQPFDATSSYLPFAPVLRGGGVGGGGANAHSNPHSYKPLNGSLIWRPCPK